MKNNTSLIYNCFLVVGDFLCLLLAFGLAYILRVTVDHHRIATPIHASTYIEGFLLLLPFWLIIFGLIGLYNNGIYEKRFNELGRLFIGSLVGILFLIGFSYAFNVSLFPAHLVALYGLVLAFAFLVTFRNVARYTKAYLYSYDIGITNVLIVGNTDTTHELISSLHNHKVSGYRIIGVVGVGQLSDKYSSHIRTYNDFEDAIKHIKEGQLNCIFQTELYAEPGANNKILTYAQSTHTAYRFIPGNTELFVGNIQVELFRSQIPVIAVHQTSLIGWGRVLKRLFDIAISAAALIILSPIFVLISLTIVVSNPGAIFFTQSRTTRFNSTFKVIKFRTLKRGMNGRDPIEVFNELGRPDLIKKFNSPEKLKESEDPRIYGFGGFLRKLSLDELPQLINVLKGDISLVGPRAIVPDELVYYEDKSSMLLSVKTGITGLAQVSGRGSINRYERAKLDIYYVQNWSFWLDLIILAKTIRIIFVKTNLV